jgi:hypothetical protein
MAYRLRVLLSGTDGTLATREAVRIAEIPALTDTAVVFDRKYSAEGNGSDCYFVRPAVPAVCDSGTARTMP